MNPFSFAPHQHHQQFQPQQLYSFQNPEQINYSKQFSSTKRVSFKDTPDSSESNSARMKKSSTKNAGKNVDKSQLPILEVLREHFVKKFHQQNQQENNEKKNSNNN